MPPLPLIVGSCVIEFSRKMEKEFPSLKNIHFGKEIFKRQDPKLVVYIHLQLLIFFLILMKAMQKKRSIEIPTKLRISVM